MLCLGACPPHPPEETDDRCPVSKIVIDWLEDLCWKATISVSVLLTLLPPNEERVVLFRCLFVASSPSSFSLCPPVSRKLLDFVFCLSIAHNGDMDRFQVDKLL